MCLLSKDLLPQVREKKIDSDYLTMITASKRKVFQQKGRNNGKTEDNTRIKKISPTKAT
jgi:hypothetical protein